LAKVNLNSILAYVVLFGDFALRADEDPGDAGVAVAGAGVQRRVAVVLQHKGIRAFSTGDIAAGIYDKFGEGHGCSLCRDKRRAAHI